MCMCVYVYAFVRIGFIGGNGFVCVYLCDCVYVCCGFGFVVTSALACVYD